MTDYTQDANCHGAWLMDTDEDPLTDSSGDGNTGALKGSGEPDFGSASPPAAYSSGYYTADGADDYAEVSVTGNANYEATEFTVVMWVRLSGTCESYGFLMSKAINAGASNPYSSWRFECISSSDINYYGIVRVAGQNKYTSQLNGLLETNVWHHIVFRVQNEETTNYYTRAYQDGSSFGVSDAWTGSIDYDSDAGEGNFYLFANGPDATYACGVDITQAAFFNRPLDSTEINDIMDNGLVGSAAAAVGVRRSYYKGRW